MTTNKEFFCLCIALSLRYGNVVKLLNYIMFMLGPCKELTVTLFYVVGDCRTTKARSNYLLNACMKFNMFSPRLNKIRWLQITRKNFVKR